MVNIYKLRQFLFPKHKDVESRMLLGKLLNIEHQKIEKINNIQEVEFKVFSQWGDDGIIQYLVNKIEIENKTFIEFGVEKYTESNTRFLLMNNNWKGLVIDGSDNQVSYIKNDNIYWQYDLTAASHFITRENVNGIFQQYGFTGSIGLLHIDIDGNDYYVWEAINVVDPAIVIVEYNAVFGYKHPISVHYDPAFRRRKYHSSLLYWGTSLKALCYLANKKGYAFIGTNMAGNNAYFVKNSLVANLPVKSPESGYTQSAFRESRDEKGNLTYIPGADRYRAIESMEVFDVDRQQSVKLKDLD